MLGFNATIFAYGQTGSGKTYTMFGPHWDDNQGKGYQQTVAGVIGGELDHFLTDKNMIGIIPRAVEQIFTDLDQMIYDALREGEDVRPDQFSVYCSFLQIYNEKLYDLF